MEHPITRRVLRRAEGLEDTLNCLLGGPLAVDTETSGLKWWEDRVGAVNLAAGTTAVVAIEDALGPTMRWLSDQVKTERELVFHNAKFDMHMMRSTFGLHIPYIVHDTNVESFMLDNRGVNAWGFVNKKAHSLKPLAQLFVDPDAIEHESALLAAIRARGGKHKGDWPILLGTEDEHLFTKYSVYDSWYTLELHRQFIERIDGWAQPIDHPYPSLRSLYETERWLINCFRDMEERGVMIDRPFLEQWRDELKVKLDIQLKDVFKLLKKEINLNSPLQLRAQLYTKRKHGGLGLTTMRRTEGGEMSTDEVALLTLGHEVGPAIVSYRETQKQYTSYGVGLLEWIGPDGAIHGSFRSTGARTGRTSCADPNLQQQTRESGVRKAYVPRKGMVFRLADYSQVEMRFASHMANEPTLVKGFNDDPDFDTHKATAQVMYGIEDPSSRQRKFGKILNFTTLFGGGKGKVGEQLQERLELADVMQSLKDGRYKLEPGESPYEALAGVLKSRYDTNMPNMKKETRRCADEAERYGLIMNLFGRHRFLDDDRWYSTFNTRVQGTAGDQAKQGLVRVYREEQLGRGSLGLLMLIHDEIVYESEGDPKTDKRVLKLMRDLTSYRVPIIAEMSGSAVSWQAKEKIKL